MELSNEQKIKLVLKRNSSLVSKGTLMKAVIEDDFDAVVRKILFVLKLNNDVPPQLQQAYVSGAYSYSPFRTRICDFCSETETDGHADWCPEYDR